MKTKLTTLNIVSLIWLATSLGSLAAETPPGREWGPANNGARMAIFLAEDSGIRARLALVVEIQNVSTNKPLSLYLKHLAEGSENLTFTARDRFGQDIPKKKVNSTASGMLVNLAPGESTRFTVDLRRLFSFVEPGPYDINGVL